MRFEHHDDPPAALCCRRDYPLGGTHIGSTARQNEIQDRIDDGGFPGGGVGDQITDRVCGFVEERFDHGLLRHAEFWWVVAVRSWLCRTPLFLFEAAFTFA